jgi:hypothetical protein
MAQSIERALRRAGVDALERAMFRQQCLEEGASEPFRGDALGLERFMKGTPVVVEKLIENLR